MFTKFIQKAFFISLLSIQQALHSVLRQILQALFLKAALNALPPTALVHFLKVKLLRRGRLSFARSMIPLKSEHSGDILHGEPFQSFCCNNRVCRSGERSRLLRSTRDCILAQVSRLHLQFYLQKAAMPYIIPAKFRRVSAYFSILALSFHGQNTKSTDLL